LFVSPYFLTFLFLSGLTSASQVLLATLPLRSRNQPEKIDPDSEHDAAFVLVVIDPVVSDPSAPAHTPYSAQFSVFSRPQREFHPNFSHGLPVQDDHEAQFNVCYV
jgi:hypothetical protein